MTEYAIAKILVVLLAIIGILWGFVLWAIIRNSDDDNE